MAAGASASGSRAPGSTSRPTCGAGSSSPPAARAPTASSRARARAATSPSWGRCWRWPRLLHRARLVAHRHPAARARLDRRGPGRGGHGRAQRHADRRLDLRGLFTRADALDALGSAFFLGVLAAIDRHNVLRMNVPSYLVGAYGSRRAPAGGGPRTHAAGPGGVVGPSQLPRVLVHSVARAERHRLPGVRPRPRSRRLRGVHPPHVSRVHVLLGSALFKEQGLAGRLGAAILAVLGAVLPGAGAIARAVLASLALAERLQ